MNIQHVHPGEVLQLEFLEPYGISVSELAEHIHVPARRLNEIVYGGRAITPDTALRLARAFDMTPRFWLNLQTRYDLERQSEVLETTLESIQMLPAVRQLRQA